MKPGLLSCAIALLALPGIGQAAGSDDIEEAPAKEAARHSDTGDTGFKVDFTSVPEPAVALLGSIGLLILLLRRK